jgi:hypothetical protein
LLIHKQLNKQSPQPSLSPQSFIAQRTLFSRPPRRAEGTGVHRSVAHAACGLHRTVKSKTVIWIGFGMRFGYSYRHPSLNPSTSTQLASPDDLCGGLEQLYVSTSYSYGVPLALTRHSHRLLLVALVLLVLLCSCVMICRLSPSESLSSRRSLLAASSPPCFMALSRSAKVYPSSLKFIARCSRPHAARSAAKLVG